MTRRNQVLDAAIHVLGTSGLRGLTHRAVDTEARLPLGSTANLFGRRTELLEAIVERLQERDHELWASAQGRPEPMDMTALAQELAGFVRHAGSPELVAMFRARYYLQLSLPDPVLAGNRALTAEVASWMSLVGADPGRVEVVMATLDGVLLRAVTFGAELVPDEQELAAALLLLMAPPA